MGETIDPTSDRPAYRQIADRLRAAIVSGELEPGSQLPSERDLIERYETARGTVRQALALLRAEGLVDAEHGRGVFVRRHPPVRRLSQDRFARKHRKAGRSAFDAEMAGLGREAEVEVLDVGPGAAPPEVADLLGLEGDATVLVRRRRYLADGEPMELATSYLPLALVEGSPICQPNPGPGGIYGRLEDMGHVLARFTEEVTARMPLPDEARSLRLASGIPVLRLVRVAYDQGGQPVEVCDTTVAADRYALSYELPAR